MGIFDKLLDAVVERAEKELESVVDDVAERIRTGKLLPEAGKVSKLEALAHAADGQSPAKRKLTDDLAETCPECKGEREPGADFIRHAATCCALGKAGCP